MTQIISKLIEIEVPEVFDNDFIEQKLFEMGIKPLRWAVVNFENNILTISVACESL